MSAAAPAAAAASAPLPADGASAPQSSSHATPAVRAASEAEKKLYGELDALEADIAAIEEDYISTYAAGNIAGGYEGACGPKVWVFLVVR